MFALLRFGAFGAYVKYDYGCKATSKGCCPAWLFYPTVGYEQQLELDHASDKCAGSQCDGLWNGVLSTTDIGPAQEYDSFQASMTWTILPCGEDPTSSDNPNYNNFQCKSQAPPLDPSKFFDNVNYLDALDYVTTFAIKQESERADGTKSTTYYTVDGCDSSFVDNSGGTKKAIVTLIITPQCCMNNKAGWKRGNVLEWQDEVGAGGETYGTCDLGENPGLDSGAFPNSNDLFTGKASAGACQGDNNGDVNEPDMRFTGSTVDHAYDMMCRQHIITRAQFQLTATLNPKKNKDQGQVQFDVKTFKSGCTVQGSVSSLSGKFNPGLVPAGGFGAFLGPLGFSLAAIVVLFALFAGGWMYLFLATGCCSLCIRCCVPPHSEEDDMFEVEGVLQPLRNVSLRSAVKAGLDDAGRAREAKRESQRTVRLRGVQRWRGTSRWSPRNLHTGACSLSHSRAHSHPRTPHTGRRGRRDDSVPLQQLLRAYRRARRGAAPGWRKVLLQQLREAARQLHQVQPGDPAPRGGHRRWTWRGDRGCEPRCTFRSAVRRRRRRRRRRERNMQRCRLH